MNQTVFGRNRLLFCMTALFLLLGSLAQAQNQTSQSPQEDRAAFIQATTAERFANNQLRWKIINSRSPILYLMDILPEKGNPYYHMADFGAQSTLEAFKKAQAYNNAEMAQTIWLPLNDGKDVGPTSFAGKNDLKAVFEYFALIVATADALETLVYPVLKNSPVILPIAESANPSVAAQFSRAFGLPTSTEDFKQFALDTNGNTLTTKSGVTLPLMDATEILDYSNNNPREKGLLQHIRDEYKKLFEANKTLKTMLDEKKRKVVLSIMSVIAFAMEDYLYVVDSKADKGQLDQFVSNVRNLSSIQDLTNPPDVATAKTAVSRVFNESGNAAKAGRAAFHQVDLPESSEIDGSTESYEAVMRLDVGYKVLQALRNHVRDNW